MIITRVDLLRHGNCEGGHIYRGRTDSALTAEGEQQMQRATAAQQWDLVYSSPLRRCQLFAQQVAEQQGIPLVLDQRLIELDFGDWDGESLETVWQQQQQAVLAFWQDPVAHPPPAGESLLDMARRVQACFQDISNQSQSCRVLVVTHGGVIRLLLAELLAVPLQSIRQLSVDYGSLTRVEYYRGEQHEQQSPEQQSTAHQGAEHKSTEHQSQVAQPADEVATEVIFSNRLPDIGDYA